MIVEFIVPTFNRLHPLKCILESLMAQTNPNWCANIVIDSKKDNSHFQLFREDYPEEIKFTYLDKRYSGSELWCFWRRWSIYDFL